MIFQIIKNHNGVFQSILNYVNNVLEQSKHQIEIKFTQHLKD